MHVSIRINIFSWKTLPCVIVLWSFVKTVRVVLCRLCLRKFDETTWTYILNTTNKQVKQHTISFNSITSSWFKLLIWTQHIASSKTRLKYWIHFRFGRRTVKIACDIIIDSATNFDLRCTSLRIVLIICEIKDHRSAHSHHNNERPYYCFVSGAALSSAVCAADVRIRIPMAVGSGLWRS